MPAIRRDFAVSGLTAALAFLVLALAYQLAGGATPGVVSLLATALLCGVVTVALSVVAAN